MSTDDNADCVIVHDRSERRQFMRRGAAFVAAAGAVAVASNRSALAATDCDRGGPGGEKPEHGGNGSDSDTGAGADPTGCGRQRGEAPKISKASPGTNPSDTRSVTVAKILG